MIAIAFIIIGISIAQAATLQTSSTFPQKIFKCQESTISVTYINTADIVSVNALVNERDGTQISYAMQNMSGGIWNYSYGNDNTTKWGNKTIYFQVITASGSYINQTSTFIFVYSDDCIGSNIQSWKNTSTRSGFGNYTTPLFTGDKNVLEVAQQPYLDYFGYAIYVLIAFSMMSILYLKTQSVAQPLLMGFLMVAVLVGSNLIQTQYKTYILLLMAVAMATIFWKLFKSA